MLVPINPLHPEPRKVRRAVEALEAGEVIGYPTDTVYGLGCDRFNRTAIDRLQQIKGINDKHQLSFICPDLSDIARYAVVDKPAYRFLRRLLPGPYTIILPATREVPKIIQSKRRTVGIRVPANEVILAVVRALGRPVISTTAARPGNEPSIDPRDIDQDFKGLALVLDGGYCGILPTTVLDLTSGEVEVIREGAGPIDDL